jgi:hypothetical protein
MVVVEVITIHVPNISWSSHFRKIFSGKVPFHKWSNSTVIFRVVYGATPPRSDAPALTDKLWEIVERCWQKEPNKRPEVSVVLECFERAHEAEYVFHSLISVD